MSSRRYCVGVPAAEVEHFSHPHSLCVRYASPIDCCSGSVASVQPPAGCVRTAKRTPPLESGVQEIRYDDMHAAKPLEVVFQCVVDLYVGGRARLSLQIVPRPPVSFPPLSPYVLGLLLFSHVSQCCACKSTEVKRHWARLFALCAMHPLASHHNDALLRRLCNWQGEKFKPGLGERKLHVIHGTVSELV